MGPWTTFMVVWYSIEKNKKQNKKFCETLGQLESDLKAYKKVLSTLVYNISQVLSPAPMPGVIVVHCTIWVSAA